MSDASATVVQALLAYVWAPLLVLAGALDWACHRRLRIEFTSGLRESALHLLMLALLGTALLAGLLLQPTAALLLLLAVAVLLHDGLYLLDLRVALARRSIPVLEQWVHGFQHLLPWAGLAGLLALFAGSAWLRSGDAAAPSAVAQWLSFGAVALSLVTAWLGGELVGRLGVGVSDGANLNAPSSLSGRDVNGRPLAPQPRGR